MTYEYEQYLAHHGIKGQKWGVRRYQNEDGSWTEEGRKRYQKYQDRVDSAREKMHEAQEKWKIGDSSNSVYRAGKKLSKAVAKREHFREKETYKNLKRLSKETSKNKDTRLSDALKNNIPEEVLSKHRKEFNEWLDKYDRMSKAAIKRKITDKEYEEFTEKYEKPHYESVWKDAQNVLGKYSSKKLTEINSSTFHYKLKMRADDIIGKAINSRLFDERYAKRKKNKQ